MKDYGVRRTGRGKAIAFGLFVLILIGAAIAALWWQGQSQQVALAGHWMVKGAPCAPTTQAAFVADDTPPEQVMEYDDIRFARAYGHVSCTDIHDHGGRGFGVLAVCQFSSPRALTVRTAKGQFYYLFRPAVPVTITIDHDQPSCVLGTTEWDRMGT